MTHGLAIVQINTMGPGGMLVAIRAISTEFTIQLQESRAALQMA